MSTTMKYEITMSASVAGKVVQQIANQIHMLPPMIQMITGAPVTSEQANQFRDKIYEAAKVSNDAQSEPQTISLTLIIKPDNLCI